ncbi:amino acid ABC transporter permease [Donghicola tyrosinivorans]|uniref:General L-amino acid transport system permease protein n=1 Tax=Donghicola tyrosinivorans TaxID=1652492 RepID=A0A2T0WZS7_9RHOB|nr:amino acid ABC transporter permease [Donghicola tyrosinivorans]PRY92212.1 general L-amino acid transport system permease protein [Donghicola tyrosinivorans]
MSDTHSQLAFVRTEMLAQKEPPVAEKGVVKWVRSNLFSSWSNSILTVVALYLIVQLIMNAGPWFANGIWSTNSLAECREILQGASGGCFSVLSERWNQLLFGIAYPDTQYWRPTLAFVLMLVAASPVLFSKLPRGMLIFTGLYPFLAYWLIWGGTMMTSIIALLGFVAAYLAFRKAERAGFSIGLGAGIIAAVVVWKVLGMFAGELSILPLEEVPSRNMGGFMLNMMLGTICISLSLPIGIALALGRQSHMPIIKGISVVFIEFIRGVPLITLLFVANVVLGYFFPPETNMDLILRVIIMITMFASAYIAEVIRGGLAALPKGQYEAADSLGLDYTQAMRFIILPQALKISIPGIVNVAVGLFKDTTLVSVISMFDLVGMIRGPILASTEWNGVYWELYGFAALLFFITCYGISQYSQWLERQLRTDHR